MKTTLLLGSLSLLGLVAAQPRQQRRHEQLHRKHQQVQAKRDDDIVWQTEYKYVTELEEVVIIYVNEEGQFLSSSVRGHAPATTSVTSSSTKSSVVVATTSSSSTTIVSTSSTSATTTPAPATSSSAITTSAAPVTTAAPVVVTTPSAVTTPAQTTSSASSSSGGSSSGSVHDMVGIAYSPYNSDGTCKSTSQVATDFGGISSSDYGYVRLYGTDCNQVSNVLAAATSAGLLVWAGIYNPAAWEAELQIIKAAASGQWASIVAVSVGNEASTASLPGWTDKSVGNWVSIMSSVRSELRSGGVTVPVVAIEQWIAVRDDGYLQLCQESDFAAMNMHPYFDTGINVGDVSTFMKTSYTEMQTLCNNGALVISETGWPTSGASIGGNVASASNQATALSQLKSALGKGYVLLSAYNDLWKGTSNGGVDAYFGVLNGGTAPSA